MSNLEMAREMCRRVRLPRVFADQMMLLATKAALRKPTLPFEVDMVLVAKAIKYAADHRSELKPQWRSGLVDYENH